MQNCSTISETLSQIDQNKTYQLWGLDVQTNLQYCGFESMFYRLVTLEDFQESLLNPFYQAQIQVLSFDSIFYPVCYAYFVFRIFMVVVIFIYLHSKIKSLLAKPDPSSDQYKIIKLSTEKAKEINVYKYIIYTAIIVEIVQSFRDFIFFRGMLFYTNLTESQPQNCYINYFTDQFTCTTNETMTPTWQPFYYDRKLCNCIYRKPSYYIYYDQGAYMSFSIISWIVTETFAISTTSFCLLSLSRINRKERSGYTYIYPTIYKTIIIAISVFIFYCLLIYCFELPIYYRFSTKSVVIFYFFWKLFAFYLIFDRLYSKIWLDSKLRFQQLHSHGIQWNMHLSKLKNKIIKQFGSKVDISLQTQKNSQVCDYFKTSFDEIKQEYHQKINQYYDQVSLQVFYISQEIQPYISRYERESNLKLQTQWYDYLNYMLILNLIGIIGYFFLVVYSYYLSSKSFFWIGFSLAVIELIVFEISNGVFKLHCFFIELYKNVSLEESARKEEDDDTSSSEED